MADSSAHFPRATLHALMGEEVTQPDQPPTRPTLPRTLISFSILWSKSGKNKLSAQKQTLRLSFLKRVVQPARQSVFVKPARFVTSALNMPSSTTNASVFGVGYPNVSVVV